MKGGQGSRTGPGRPEPPMLQLRPLFLPEPGRSFEPSGHGEPGDDTMAQGIPDYKVFGVHPVEAERVFWYRWITGHQVSFALWRAMYDIFGDSPDTMPPRPELDVLAACVDAYSAMLLYSSTVPCAHYHSHIRRRMALQHPAISGTWAPDYRPVRRLFRGKLSWQGDPACEPLGTAVARNAAAHDYIAAHLVPDGLSLLQQSIGTPAMAVSQEKEELYDNLFLTLRRPISRIQFVGQLRARVAEVGTDLAHNGLYPNVEGHHHPVVTGHSGGIMMTLVPGALRALDEATRLVARHQLQGVGA
ncbi:hypothetical protein ACFPA8_10635 [Streptomyces ovatisporus]|uniref:Uncharacterized protein n=1 Tax=Streptomyces ovatisporus TaxID=1128682 RepID=A0ABV9A3V8_9ACTN